MSELDLPSHVLTEIGSPIRETRLAGVDELIHLASGAELAMAWAARQALQRLTEDDSRSVAAAATAGLERTGVLLNPDRIDFGQVAPGTPRLIADVLVDGPPLAVAAATVSVSGPGLRAMLAGRRLRVMWVPRSDWLDGSVTVRGSAGWADVRVTGQVAASEALTQGAVEDQARATGGGRGGLGPYRMTVLPPTPPPRARRRVGAVFAVAGLVALVLLGGVGVAVALTTDRQAARKSLAVAGPLPSLIVPSDSAATSTAPLPSSVTRVPLAARVTSADRPVVVATVRVGNEPEGVAVSPDGRTVWVADQGARLLSVIDAATRRVTSVRLRDTARFVSTSRDGRLVFVSMYEDDLSGSGVAVLDAASRKVIKYLNTGVQPYTLSVAPDGRLWVPIHSARRIEIYAAGDQRGIGRILLLPNPHAVAFSTDLMRAFTPNHESNAVSVIDMRTDQVLKSIPVSKSPHSIAVSPDGRTVLVAGFDANAVNLIDARTLRRTGPFKVGSKPQSVAFAADGRHAYVVNEGDQTVSVLNARTGAVTATIRMGLSPRAVAVSPDGRLAYVSNGDSDTVSVLRVGE
jgi:YVTN family beta-propeller protein